jgi:hypothetical protein
MTLDKIVQAVVEANKFIRRAEAVMKLEDNEPYSSPRETGALRRQSMELTRALADLRKRDQ